MGKSDEGGPRGKDDQGQGARAASASPKAQGDAEATEGQGAKAQAEDPGTGAGQAVLEKRDFFLLTPDGFDDYWKDLQDVAAHLRALRREAAQLVSVIGELRAVGEQLADSLRAPAEARPSRPARLEAPAPTRGAVTSSRPPVPAASPRAPAAAPGRGPAAAAARRPLTSERGAPQTSGRSGFAPAPKLSLGVRAELPPAGPPPERPAPSVELRQLGLRASVRARLLAAGNDAEALADLLDELGIDGPQRARIREIVAVDPGDGPE